MWRVLCWEHAQSAMLGGGTGPGDSFRRIWTEQSDPDEVSNDEQRVVNAIGPWRLCLQEASGQCAW